MQTYTSIDQQGKIYTLIVRQDRNDNWVGTTQERPWISSQAPTKNELLRTVGNALCKELERERRRNSHQECDEIKEIVWTDKENWFQQKIDLYGACSDALGIGDSTFGYYIQEDGSLKLLHQTQPNLATTWTDISTLDYVSSLNQERSSYQKLGITWAGMKRRVSDDYFPRLAPMQDDVLSRIDFGALPESAYGPVPIQGEDDSLKLLYQTQLGATWGDLKKGSSIDSFRPFISGQPYVSLSGIPLATIDGVYEDILPGIIPIPSPELYRVLDLVPVTPHHKVFIVHGHDHESRDIVADFVKKLGLTATILDKEPNKGGTIIEKFEQCANESDFAIVLMTPDDVAAPVKNGTDPKVANFFSYLNLCWSLFKNGTYLKYRPRQNVTFELGYFCGSIGRERVCILHKGNLELPSDIQGIVYVPMGDDGEWQQTVIKEMVAARILVERNKVQTYPMFL